MLEGSLCRMISQNGQLLLLRHDQCLKSISDGFSLAFTPE
jgi:hypothetical protein